MGLTPTNSDGDEEQKNLVTAPSHGWRCAAYITEIGPAPLLDVGPEAQPHSFPPPLPTWESGSFPLPCDTDGHRTTNNRRYAIASGFSPWRTQRHRQSFHGCRKRGSIATTLSCPAAHLSHVAGRLPVRNSSHFFACFRGAGGFPARISLQFVACPGPKFFAFRCSSRALPP